MSLTKAKKLFVIALAVIVVVATVLSLLTQVAPTKPNVVSPIQKANIGRTKETEIEKLSGHIKQEVLPNGDVKHEFSSAVSIRPDTIITKGGVAVFERIDVPQNPKAVGYAKISQAVKAYGEAEKVIQGSAFFGPFTSTFIYSSRGFAFIANPHTDEVYEIQVFTPMPVASYIEMYGDDIEEGPPPEEPLY